MGYPAVTAVCEIVKDLQVETSGENEIVDLLIYENENYTMTLFLAKASISLFAEISGSCLTVLPHLITSLHHPNGLERLASRTTPP